MSGKKTFKTVAVILSFFLLLLVLSFGVYFSVYKMNKQARTIVDLLGCDLIILPKAAEKYAYQFVVADSEKSLYLPAHTYEKLRNEPEIERLTYHVHFGKPPLGCCTYIDGPIIAFEEESDFILPPLVVERSKSPPLTQHEILAGSSVYNYLGLIKDIVLLDNDTKIVGHLKDTGTNYDNCVFMRVEDIATISSEYLPNYPSGGISVIFIQLSAGSDVVEFAAKIKKYYPGTATISKGSFFQELKALL